MSGPEDLYQEAIDRLRALLKRARRSGLQEPTAVTLATADRSGRASARMVLLKGADERGFVFCTDTLSRKGRRMAANPRAALCLFWDPLMEQVTVEGVAQLVSEAEAEAAAYRLVPDRIEFWKRRPFRLNERTLYRESRKGWSKTLLYP